MKRSLIEKSHLIAVGFIQLIQLKAFKCDSRCPMNISDECDCNVGDFIQLNCSNNNEKFPITITKIVIELFCENISTGNFGLLKFEDAPTEFVIHSCPFSMLTFIKSSIIY